MAIIHCGFVPHQNKSINQTTDFSAENVGYNLKKTLVIILLLAMFSCNEKDNCYPEFKESLLFVKGTITDNKPRLEIEIKQNVKVLESISGILNKDRGHNTLNTMFITQADIKNWEEWVAENCDSLIKVEKQ